MANKKFSAFTNQPMTASSELVGFDGGANTRYTIDQLKTGLDSGRFYLSCAYATAAGATTSGMLWFGGAASSGGSQEDGALYVFRDFKIISIVQRYTGRAGISIGAGEGLNYTLATLNPSAAGPPADWANSNDPANGTTLITNFGNVFDLTSADNLTFPYTKFTPGTPIQCTADTMLLMTQQEVGSVTPTASEMQFFFLPDRS